MKYMSVKKALLALSLALGVFLLLVWGNSYTRGFFAAGGEIFVPSGIILAVGYLIGGKDE